jgi:drug/metabolite transporter (DMT)-like permease
MASLAAVWGASYLFIKVSLDDLPAAWIVFLRTALGAAVLLPVAARRGALAGLRGRARPLVVMALVQVVGPFLLITFGERWIASSLTGILVSSAPIFMAILAVWVDHEERSHGWALVGVLTGIVGVGLLFGVDLSGSGTALLGGAMVLLASFGYAVGALWLKRSLRGVPAVGLAGSTMALSAVFASPLLLVDLPGHGPGLDTLGSMLALGAGGTGVAFLLFYTLIADVGPARASLVAYIAPGFAVLYGVTLRGESFGDGTALGLVLILVGSWLGAEGRLPGRFSRSGPSRSSVPAPARAR